MSIPPKLDFCKRIHDELLSDLRRVVDPHHRAHLSFKVTMLYNEAEKCFQAVTHVAPLYWRSVPEKLESDETQRIIDRVMAKSPKGFERIHPWLVEEMLRAIMFETKPRLKRILQEMDNNQNV